MTNPCTYTGLNSKIIEMKEILEKYGELVINQKFGDSHLISLKGFKNTLGNSSKVLDAIRKEKSKEFHIVDNLLIKEGLLEIALKRKS